MTSVYQTEEWRQGGGPPGRNTHSTDLGGGPGQRGMRDPNRSQGTGGALEDR